MNFELAQKVADAVWYEGYVLYPSRASATKNQVRWQFVVIAPRRYHDSGGSEPWAMQIECLVEPDTIAVLDLKIRFLQVQARTVEEAVDVQADLFRAVATLEMNPEAVFGLLKSLGGTPQQMFIVGCEPARIEEELDLSEPVAQAVDEAVQLILGLVRHQGDANTYGYMMFQK